MIRTEHADECAIFRSQITCPECDCGVRAMFACADNDVKAAKLPSGLRAFVASWMGLKRKGDKP